MSAQYVKAQHRHRQTYDSKSARDVTIEYAKDASIESFRQVKRNALYRDVNTISGSGTGDYKRTKTYKSSETLISGGESGVLSISSILVLRRIQ